MFSHSALFSTHKTLLTFYNWGKKNLLEFRRAVEGQKEVRLKMGPSQGGGTHGGEGCWLTAQPDQRQENRERV